MKKLIRAIFNNREPGRFLLLKLADRLFNFLKYTDKLRWSTIDRPHYGHSLLHAALLAKRLGIPRISAIEFGVAGGNGLVSLEEHAIWAQKETGVEIDIYGFDTGSGMPPPTDYRDLPYMWQAGYFSMDPEKLKARLRNAKLVLGPVGETVSAFCASHNPAPIGFIAFDLDYYSSTVSALKLLNSPHNFFLPRVNCYVDDMTGDIDWAYNEFTGELLAINEFNAYNAHMKIARVEGLRFLDGRLPAGWHEQIFVCHLFNHPQYGHPISDLKQLPLQ